MDCDGYDDVIVGAPGWEQGAYGEDEGSAWIYRGSSTGMIDAPYWHKESNIVGAQLGYSVAGAGDVNGDGCADVIIGAPYGKLHASHDEEGFVYVYRGFPNGIDLNPYFLKQSDNMGAHFGWSVASAGDVNRDGLSDIIIGCARLFG